MRHMSRHGGFAVPGVLACVVSLRALVLLPGTEAASAVDSSSAVKVVDVSGVGLSGVSCNSKTFCVAVGSEDSEDQGAVLPISHGVPETAEIISDAGSWSSLSAISCPDSTHCVAVGEFPTKSPQGPTTTAGLVVGIKSGTPGSYSRVLGPGLVASPDWDYLYGVGCTTKSECKAAGEDAYLGGIVVPLTTEEVQGVDDYRMNGASCFAKNYCIATGASEPESGGPNSGIAVGGKVGQTKGWAEWDAGSSLNGAGCHSDNSDSCVAVGSNTKGNKGVVLSIVNLTQAKAENVPGVTGLNGVACEGASYCVAVGQNSAGEGVLVGFTGNRVGATVPVPGTSQLVAVGCASNMSCIAVGSDDSDEAVLVEFSLPLR